MDGPDSNRRPSALTAALPGWATVQGSAAFRTKAYATAKPRAPDGKQTRTVMIRSLTLPITAPDGAAMVSGTRPVAGDPCHSPPVPKHPGTALMRCMNGSTPAAEFIPGASGWNRHRRFDVVCFLGERRKQNAPGCLVRGRSRGLGRSGWPIFRGREDQRGQKPASASVNRFAGRNASVPRHSGRGVG